VLSPGAVAFIAISAVISIVVASCGATEPTTPTERRTWEGPSSAVASTGVEIYERREIAQKVSLPACLSVGPVHYRFVRVTPFTGGGTTPPGLTDTFYRLDRWRLWIETGPPEGQERLFVTVRGSTGVLADYERLPLSEQCNP